MRLLLAPFVLAAVVSFAACNPALAQSAQADATAPKAPVEPAAPTTPPRLVLAIAVDQFSADLFSEYRAHFTGGLARLMQGAVFPQGYQSHAATETCPGHATILTGVHPSRSGIIANNWFDPGIARAEKKVYCAEDVTDPASSAGDPVVSARFLKVPTLGERLKAANPASRNVAVSGKDRAVMMMGGNSIDAAWWWKGDGFATLKGRPPVPAAAAVNAASAAAIMAGASAFAVPVWCASRDRAVQVGRRTIGTGRFAIAPGNSAAFRLSPYLDSATADLALRLVNDLDLGRGAAQDVLSVSLSGTDYIGHTFGTEGLEMCIQMAALDQTIGRILDHLDARGIDYVTVLTADHGGFDAPERAVLQGNPGATRVDASLRPAELNKIVSVSTGITMPWPLLLADGPMGDFYVADGLAPADKARVIAALVGVLRRHPEVAAVFTHAQLAATTPATGAPQDWTLAEIARASFDAERSGNVVVLLARNVQPLGDPDSGVVATHGSPWGYDRRVPILFWRKGVPGLEQPAPIETVDIAPTLAAILRLPVPDGAFDGRCLDIDGSAANTCAR